MSIFSVGASSPSGFELKSCRFDKTAVKKLTRTPSSAGNLKTWTISFWMKPAMLPTASGQFYIYDGGGVSTTETALMIVDQGIEWNYWSSVANSQLWKLKTDQVFRDQSAWYHIVSVYDSPQATAANRLKLYVNGSQVTSFSTANYPSQNLDASMNDAYLHAIGTSAKTNIDWSGYLAEYYLIDGTALTPASFGETNVLTNQWQPKRPAIVKGGVTFGTNGFHLDFETDGTNTSFVDSSSNSRAVTAVGSVTHSPVQSKFNSSSIYFDGSGDALTMADGSHWDFGTGSFTVEFWCYKAHTGKESVIESRSTSGDGFNIEFSAAHKLEWYDDSISGTTPKDTTAITANTWTHYAIVRNGTTFTMYRDGSSVGTPLTGDSSSQASAGGLDIGRRLAASTSNDFTGYLDDIRVSSTARYTSNFSVPTAAFTSDSDTVALIQSKASNLIGGDKSGEGNHFASTNLTASDLMPDSPMNNFATLNPLDKVGTNGSDLAEGNLKSTGGSLPSKIFSSTIAASTGKWYAEIYQTTNNYTLLGVADADIWTTLHNSGGIRGSGAITWDSGGTRYYINSTSQTNSVAGASTNILQIAFDADNRKVWFGINNTWNGSGNPAAGTNEIGTVAGTGDLLIYVRPESTTQICNFGQDSSFVGNKTAQSNQDGNDKGDFYYTPPSGFLALCTDNLANPSIALPGEHFNTVLYTGTGSAQAITGVGFSPDVVWVKDRSASNTHVLVDSIRQDFVLYPDTDQAEGNTGGGWIHMPTASDGFTVDSNSPINTNTNNYVSWNWKANGSGSANTDGAISSTVSVNAAAGFSIVKYQGSGTNNTTVGHGLSQAPTLWITKNRDTASTDWETFTTKIDGSVDFLRLNESDSKGDSGRTAPTSSVFYVGSGNNQGASGDNYIAYCFHSVEGYSKIGSYAGNNSADGKFIHTGFRPAFIIIKRTDATEQWPMYDNKKIPYNEVKVRSAANSATADDTSEGGVDMVSNGFKCRTTWGGINSSNDFIYMAFAESPFKTSNAR